MIIIFIINVRLIYLHFCNSFVFWSIALTYNCVANGGCDNGGMCNPDTKKCDCTGLTQQNHDCSADPSMFFICHWLLDLLIISYYTPISYSCHILCRVNKKFEISLLRLLCYPDNYIY